MIKMKYLLLLSFVAFGAAKSMLGEKKCTYGPAYWCKSLQTAHECGAGAVIHCASKVWPKAQQDTMCSVCTEAVTVVHSFLDNNATEEEILNVLKKVCSEFGSMASECTALIDSYGAEIIEIIAQYTKDANSVCKLLGMCSASKSLPLVKINAQTPINIHKLMMPGPVIPSPIKETPSTNIGSSAQCVICEYVMEYVDKIITKSSTQEEIENALDRVCKLMPSTVSLKCQEFVNTFTPAILNILSQYADPKVVCSMLQLCTASANEVTSKLQMPRDVSSGIMCEACSVIVGYIDNELKNNSTEEAIIATLEKVCTYIPNAAIANECKAIIGEYGRQIIALLVAELDPATVCKELGLCSATKVLKMEMVKAGVTCTICEAAVSYLDSMLKSNATEAEIVALLNQGCSLLPSEFQTECTTLVNEYVPYIIKLLEQQSPQAICTLLGLCQAQKPMSLNKKAVKLTPLRLPKGNEMCEICEMAVGYLEKMLKDNATEAEIMQMLDTLCNYLPSSLQTECQTFITEYVKMAIQALSSMTPDEVCKELGLCTSMKKQKLVGGKKCTWGPSYWCSSEAAAKSCKAYEHCAARKWQL